MELTIDIETIPDQRDGAYEEILADVCANFKAPSSLTKEQAAIDLGLTDKDKIQYTSKAEMIARWERELASVKSADVAEEKYRATALNGSKGEICVIGFKFGEESASSIQRIDGATEQDIVRLFYDKLREVLTATPGSYDQLKLIGHNHQAFDLRFLWQRSVINNVKPPIELLLPKYSNRVFDTMTAWAGDKYISLDNLCQSLGVESPKDEMDGSMVWDYYKAGRIADIARYCRRDVEATYQCYRKMTFSEQQPVSSTIPF